MVNSVNKVKVMALNKKNANATPDRPGGMKFGAARS